MYLRELQAAVDARDEARLREIESRYQREERERVISNEIASEIMRDPQRLACFFERGDIILSDVIVVDSDGATRTLERLLAIALSDAFVRNEHGTPLARLVRAIHGELSASADVREKAAQEAAIDYSDDSEDL